MNEDAPPQGIPSARGWFDGCEDLWDHLTPASRRVLDTAATLQCILDGATAPDLSPLILLMFKALEIELLVRVHRPFRAHVLSELPTREAERAIEALKDERWTRSLGRFLHGGRPPTLAEASSLLAGLGGVACDTPGSAASLLKRWLRRRLPSAHRFWGPEGLARRLEESALRVRNRFAHEHVAGRDDLARAFQRLWGDPAHHGLIPRVLRALTRGLGRPEPLHDPCPDCGQPLWAYPLRLPERHCPLCAVVTDWPA